MTLEQEIAKRRTFGIISHPDAGKTTLTEKLLLFGGAIQKAGAVKSSKIKDVELTERLINKEDSNPPASKGKVTLQWLE